MTRDALLRLLSSGSTPEEQAERIFEALQAEAAASQSADDFIAVHWGILTVFTADGEKTPIEGISPSKAVRIKDEVRRALRTWKGFS